MSGRRKDVSVIHAVACPTCTAERGQDCVRMSRSCKGTPVGTFHVARKNAAVEHYVRRLNALAGRTP